MSLTVHSSGVTQAATPRISLTSPPHDLTEEELRKCLISLRVPYDNLRVHRVNDSPHCEPTVTVEFSHVEHAVHWHERQKGVISLRPGQLSQMVFTSQKTDVGTCKYCHSMTNSRSKICMRCGRRQSQSGDDESADVAPSISRYSSGDRYDYSRDDAPIMKFPPRARGTSRYSPSRTDDTAVHDRVASEPYTPVNAPASEKPKSAAEDGADLIGINPCNTVLLRGLDGLTDEKRILDALSNITSLEPLNCYVMRNVVTNVSLGFGFMEFDTVANAKRIIDYFNSEDPFEVDGKLLVLDFAKNTFKTIMAGISLAKEQHQREQEKKEELKKPRDSVRGVSPPRRELPFAPQRDLIGRHSAYDPANRNRDASPYRSRRSRSPVDSRSYDDRSRHRERSRHSPERSSFSKRRDRELPYDPKARPASPIKDHSNRDHSNHAPKPPEPPKPAERPPLPVEKPPTQMDKQQLELLRIQQQAKEQLEKEARERERRAATRGTADTRNTVSSYSSTAPSSIHIPLSDNLGLYSEETYSGYLYENESGLYKGKGAVVPERCAFVGHSMANSLDLRIFDDKEIVPNGRLEDLITAAVKLLGSKALSERLVCCYVFFGITDLLDVKQSDNYREVVLRESGDVLLMSKIDWAARTLKDKGVMPVFCTFPPMSFLKHNQYLLKNGLTGRLKHVDGYSTMQIKLNEMVAKVNTRIEEVNCSFGVVTCQLSAKVFSCEKNKYVLKEAYLKDGLHLTTQGATLLNLELAQNLRKAKQGKRSPDWLKKSHQVKSSSAISFSIKKKEEEKPLKVGNAHELEKHESSGEEMNAKSRSRNRSKSPSYRHSRNLRSRSRSRDRDRHRERADSGDRHHSERTESRFRDHAQEEWKPSLLGEKPNSLLGSAPASSPEKNSQQSNPQVNQSGINTLAALARMPNDVAQSHAQQLQQQLAQQLTAALGAEEAQKLMSTLEQRFGRPSQQGSGFNPMGGSNPMNAINQMGANFPFNGPVGGTFGGVSFGGGAFGGGAMGAAGLLGEGGSRGGGGSMGGQMGGDPFDRASAMFNAAINGQMGQFLNQNRGGGGWRGQRPY